MRIEAALLDEIIEHLREDPENELCGVVAAELDNSPAGAWRAVEVRRARNMHASPLRFEIEPKELYELVTDIEERGWRVGAIYHSHVRSSPYPSQTDINYAAGWPDVEWLIVGLANETPEVRSYLIDRGVVQEVSLETG